jgi:hypothetical protein
VIRVLAGAKAATSDACHHVATGQKTGIVVIDVLPE